mmetsp:Transcript_25836/g.76353  ORF Transcript_25836/g.76353 Transcript_25836/m.76353 type:complete len:276 (+) Transcript_25836:352-1179(+)
MRTLLVYDARTLHFQLTTSSQERFRDATLHDARLLLHIGGNLHKKIVDGIGVVIGGDGVLGAEELLLGRNSAENQQSPQSVVGPEEHVRVEPIPHHAYAGLVQFELVGEVIDHERAGLPHDGRLPPRAPLYRADHAPVPRPLLRVGQVGDGVAVGGDEFAPRILVDAQLGVLDLVVVDLAIESHDHGADVRVVLEPSPLPHVGFLPLIAGTAEPVGTDEIELLPDPHLPDDVDLLPRFVEFRLLEVRRGGEGGGEDLLGGYVETEGVELPLVPFP